MSSSPARDDAIFESFDIAEETYKTVGTHTIQAAVLTPKHLAPGRHPVIVHVHGGGWLVTGAALGPASFPPWVLDLALAHGAVVVAPDYRLVPSARGVADVLEDLEDFWTWTRPGGGLAAVVLAQGRGGGDDNGHALDLDRLLLAGHAAGGYAAALLALAHPAQARALALVAPILDIKDPRFVHGAEPEGPPLMGVPDDRLPSAEATRAWIAEARPVVRSRGAADLAPYALAAVRHGLLYRELYDNTGANEPAFNPIERLRAGAPLPPHVWILHGEADSVVHLRQSTDFADFAAAHLPGTELRLDVAKGRDHGFERQIPPAVWEAEHAPGALEFVKCAWLGP